MKRLVVVVDPVANQALVDAFGQAARVGAPCSARLPSRYIGR